MLDDLLVAVESEPQMVDIGRISSFLQKVSTCFFSLWLFAYVAPAKKNSRFEMAKYELQLGHHDQIVYTHILLDDGLDSSRMFPSSLSSLFMHDLSKKNYQHVYHSSCIQRIFNWSRYLLCAFFGPSPLFLLAVRRCFRFFLSFLLRFFYLFLFCSTSIST